MFIVKMNGEDSSYFQNTSVLKFNVCPREDYSIFSKRKNKLQFNMRIGFKMNQTKKISSP